MKPEIINMLTWEDVKEIADAYMNAEDTRGDWLVKKDGKYYISQRLFFTEILQRLRDNNMSEGRKRYLYLIGKAEQATGAKATRSKNFWSVLTRSFVSYRMWKEGMTYMDIGRLCDRDHATIINQVRKVEDILALPSAFKNENALYYKFERLLEDGE